MANAFANLFAFVDFAYFLIQDLIALLTDLNDLCAFDTESCEADQSYELRNFKHLNLTSNSLENLLRNCSCGLVLRESVGIVQAVVYRRHASTQGQNCSCLSEAHR